MLETEFGDEFVARRVDSASLQATATASTPAFGGARGALTATTASVRRDRSHGLVASTPRLGLDLTPGAGAAACAASLCTPLRTLAYPFIRQVPEQLRRVRISFADLRFTKLLGSGNFGDVHLAEWRGTPVAVTPPAKSGTRPLTHPYGAAGRSLSFSCLQRCSSFVLRPLDAGRAPRLPSVASAVEAKHAPHRRPSFQLPSFRLPSLAGQVASPGAAERGLAGRLQGRVPAAPIAASEAKPTARPP